MKLKNLKINNFVGVESAEVTFGKPVSLFVGKNGQGKSTIAKDAIEFALTGRCRALKYHKDVGNIMHGDDGMLTELDYLDDSGADVKAKRSKSTIGVNTDDRAVLHYCLNPADFIELPPKERAKILAEVLGGGMDDVIKNAIAEHIGKVDETVLAEIKGSKVNVLDVDALRNEVIEIRRSYKRLIGDLPDKAPLLSDYDLEDGYVVAKDQGAVKDLAERIKNGTQLLADAKMMLQTKAEIADLERAIRQIESDKKDIPKLPRGVSKEKLDVTPVYMCILEDMLKGINGEATDVCPICEQQVNTESLKAVYQKLTKWFDKYRDTVSKRAEAEQHNQRSDTERDIKSKLLEEAKAKLKEVDVPKDGEELLTQLQAERDAAQARIANYRHFEIDKSTFEKAREKREALEGLIVECNRIDKALKDGGPVKAAIAAGGRTLPINEALLKAWGMQALSWSDNGEIALRDLPIEYASKSERQRAACVMGLALAEVSGIGVAAIDEEFDSFDENTRNALFDSVTACKLNNVLICNSTTKKFGPSNVPWLEIFSVEEGKVTHM